MSDTILTLTDVQGIFQTVTVSLTGLDPDRGVRIVWQTDAAPDWRIDEDVAFIYTTLATEPYIQQRNVALGSPDGAGIFRPVTAYTRVHQVRWVFYGPGSFENAEALRNGIYLDATRANLAARGLYPVLDIPAVTRAPELFNRRWWERSDISIRFNELVRRESAVPAVEIAEITAVWPGGSEVIAEG